MLGQQLRDAIGLAQSTHKGHHDLHIGQAHVAAHALDGFAFHGKSFTKIFTDVARCATEAQHGVFFFWLVTAATNEFAVLVAFEIGQSNNDRLGPKSGCNAGHAFGHFVDVKRFGRSMTAGHRLDCFFQIGIDVGVIQNGFGMHANVVVDDELQARQADALVWQLRKVKCQLWIAHIHHDFGGNLWHGAACHFGHFGF